MCTFLKSTELSKFYGFMDIFPFSFARCFSQLKENKLIYGLTMLPYKTSRSLLKPSSWNAFINIISPQVDLVEQDKHFLEKATEYLAGK